MAAGAPGTDPGLNLGLLLLLDSRSPAGGHGHSSGVEPAVAAGFVDDLETLQEFTRARLKTAGGVSASFAALAWRAHADGAGPSEWRRVDDEFSARTVAPAGRSASRALGRGLRRLVTAAWPEAVLTLDTRWALIERPAPHHALVLGAAVAIAGGSALDAARAAANTAVSGPGSAALRLLGLDPYEVYGAHHRLLGEIEAVAERGCAAAFAHADLRAAARQLPSESAPAMEILAEFHLQQEVRLFAS